MSRQSFGGMCVSCQNYDMFKYDEIMHNNPDTDVTGECLITKTFVKAGDCCKIFCAESIDEVRARMKRLSMMKTNVKKDENKAKKDMSLFKGRR